MKPGTKREHLDALRPTSFIAPVNAISTQQLTKNVLSRARPKPLKYTMQPLAGFKSMEHAFTRVLKTGKEITFLRAVSVLIGRK
jgi:hypothetical protein